MRKSSKQAVSRSATKSSYAVIIPSKNGEATIRQTLNSLLKQTIRPETMIVIDDASTDGTPQILNDFPEVRKIRLNHNLPKDFARVPKLINLGFNQIAAPCDYVMISGDDCIFPTRYVELLLSEFEHDPNLLVVSGSHMAQKIVEEASPHGAGRIMAYRFLRSILPFPESIGWESWVLFKALQKGGAIKRVPEASFTHMRPYSSGSVRTFGQSMCTLGYPVLFVIARFLKNLLYSDYSSRFHSLYLILGYVEFCITRQRQLDDVKSFVRSVQKARLVSFIRRQYLR